MTMIHAKPRFTMFLAAALAAALAPSLAFAQPADEIKPDDPELVAPATQDPTARAREFYSRGRKNYDLGKFRRAIALFTRAYEELPNEAFLFNIAQSYRQLDDCKQSLFFYKRFLSVAKEVEPDTKKEVDGHITALTQCVKNQEDIRNRPPDGTNPPNGIDPGTGTTTGGATTGGTTTGGTATGGTTTGGTQVGMAGPTGGGGEVDEPDDPETPTGASSPTLLAVFARGGAARFAAGSRNAVFVASAGLSAGYPIAVGDKLSLDVGAGFGYMPVAWQGTMAGVSGTASFLTLAGHAGATYTVAPKIGLRGEVDVGALVVTGLAASNPFTRDGLAPTGALSMLSVRAALAAEYALSPSLSVVVTPVAFSFSPAKSSDFTAEVDAFTRLEFLAGLGYRM
ncbi:MAG: hypothetical protein R3B06_20045 [Kofleriaceae bacterium]